MVGKPLPKSYCEVCSARAVLAKEFPGTVEEEIREREYHKLYIPEDLFH
jgi:hypothetical protein